MTEDELLLDMKYTCGSRFIAASRLKKSYRRRQWLMVAFSIVVAGISAVTLVFTLADPYPKLFGFVGLIASMIIITVSAAQIESGDAVNSHLLYNSAVEISNMRRGLRAAPDTNRATIVANFSKEYGELLSSYGVNHEERDFEAYKRRHRWEFPEMEKAAFTNFAKEVSAKVADSLPFTAGIGAAAAALAGLLTALLGN